MLPILLCKDPVSSREHLIIGCPHDAAPIGAWPLACPSPSGPLGWQRSPGSTARRRRVPRSGMRSTVEAGRAQPGQCGAFRPADFDILPATDVSGATLTARSRCCRARQRDTAGTARGRSPGVRYAAAAAPWGLRPKDAAKLPPRHGGTPGEPQPPMAGHPNRLSSQLLAPVLAVTAKAVRPGAPEVRP